MATVGDGAQTIPQIVPNGVDQRIAPDTLHLLAELADIFPRIPETVERDIVEYTIEIVLGWR